MKMILEVGTGIVANFLYERAKKTLPDAMKQYVPALFNADPAYIREAERLVDDAIDGLRVRYKEYRTIGIFLGSEKTRREGVLAPIFEYLLFSGEHPRAILLRSIMSCRVGGEFQIQPSKTKSDSKRSSAGDIAGEIIKAVEQRFSGSEKLIGFLTHTCLSRLNSKAASIESLAKNLKVASDNREKHDRKAVEAFFQAMFLH